MSIGAFVAVIERLCAGEAVFARLDDEDVSDDKEEDDDDDDDDAVVIGKVSISLRMGAFVVAVVVGVERSSEPVAFTRLNEGNVDDDDELVGIRSFVLALSAVEDDDDDDEEDPLEEFDAGVVIRKVSI